MKIITNFSLVLFMGLMMTYVSIGQDKNMNASAAMSQNGYSPSSLITDYFRTKASGIWTDTSTWESSPDGITWQNATLTPSEASNRIEITTGDTVNVIHSVIVNQTVVDSGAVLIINPPGSDTKVVFKISNGPDPEDMMVWGTVISTGEPDTTAPFSIDAWGVLAFEAGSVYDHNQNGGSIPISVWKPGSTLKLTGVIDRSPANKSQNYSNIIVNLPLLTFNLNMGFQDNVISGDITILSTGIHRWVLVGPQTDTTRTVTIMGNIYVMGGTFNSHGTENPNSHAVIHTYGDIIVTAGNFSIVRGNQGGTGTTLWYLHGSLSISNATTQNANPPGAKFIYEGPGEHRLTLSNVTFGPGGLPIEVDTASLDLGTSILRGDGIFSLSPGSVLSCGVEGGIDSSIQTSGTISLSPEADYVYNGTGLQVTGVRLPQTVNNLTINNSGGVIMSGDVTVKNQLSILAGYLDLGGRIVTLGSSAMLNETGGLVKGSSGKITTTRNLNAPSGLNVGGLGLVLTSTGDLGMTTIERTHSPAQINGTAGINRQFNVIPGNTGFTDAVVRLYYDESEIDTITESNLRFYSSSDGSLWVFNNGTLDTTQNFFEVSGLTTLSHMTLGYGSAPVSVKDNPEEVPSVYALYQNYPNPFNPETVIKFDLPEDSRVNISIYNIIGEKVLTLIDGSLSKGRYTKTLDASGLASGIYIYKLSSEKAAFTKKMILMK